MAYLVEDKFLIVAGFGRFAVAVSLAVIFVFGTGTSTNAGVVAYDGYFQDTNTGWYWYAGVDEFVNQDWETAGGNIDSLLKGGMIWEMASVSDIKTLKDYYVPVDLILTGSMRFTTEDKSIWGWLSDEGRKDGEKSIAGLLFDGVSPSLDSFKGTNKHPSIGAFAVAKPNVTP